MSTIWCIGAGDKAKDMVPTMIINQMMILGPGNTGDISNLGKEEVSKLVKAQGKGEGTANMLLWFRDKARKGEIVVLRLGSVCIAVGTISGLYKWRQKFGRVYSYWNKGGRTIDESPWDLRHIREVKWYILKKSKALCFFRRGLYWKWSFGAVRNKHLISYLKNSAMTALMGTRCYKESPDEQA